MGDVGVSPYRPLVVVDDRRPARVEAAHCGWCRFLWAGCCEHPTSQYERKAVPKVVADPPHRARVVNPRGECPHWSPPWLTRWMRRLRLGRAPAMVDPRVWDE